MGMSVYKELTASEIEEIKRRVESWPDYKKQNYKVIFGEILSVDFCMTK